MLGHAELHFAAWGNDGLKAYSTLERKQDWSHRAVCLKSMLLVEKKDNLCYCIYPDH